MSTDNVNGLAMNGPSKTDDQSHPANVAAQDDTRHAQVHLADYILPLRGDIDVVDIEFLQKKGAFRIPDEELRDQLLVKYVLYVHPFLPLLDLEEFFAAIGGKQNSRKIGLLLFQAVLFTAVPFVDLYLLQTEGYESREEARRKCFEKVRLLFDFNLELNQITLIQSVLLMTLWYEMPEDIKGRSHWLKIALSYAHEIGLNRYSQLAGLSAKEQQARKRLWWCCYTRDRIISLNERQIINIRDEVVELPTLEECDFETKYLADRLERYHIDEPLLQAKVLAELFIQKIQLCMLFGQVLDTLYIPRGHQRSYNVETKIVLVPKTSASAAGNIITLDQELCRWAAECRAKLEALAGHDSTSKYCILDVHHTLLGLLYHTIRSMVHRPHLCQVYTEGSQAQALQAQSQPILRASAQGCTDLAKRLTNDGRIKYLAPIGITTLLFAGVQHISDINSGELGVRAAAEHCLDQTLQSLYRLREVYDSARHAIGLLRIVHRSKTLGIFPEDRSGHFPTPQVYPHSTYGQATIPGAPYTNAVRGNGIAVGLLESERRMTGSLDSPSAVVHVRNNLPASWESGPDAEDMLGLYDPVQEWFGEFFEFPRTGA
ncbi:hypothetical protein LTR84_003033 [Exophiala bonariae]|uniref:Xylanolytic transcriptional activator regulatory domain-containing protein n=1 Tax=Exophiala bonariae TaxID=1690606 RepID=A0AAV9N7Y3_9EURO|nr:hypothetical protein LTR84_003033 [Exophiala bonariae]